MFPFRDVSNVINFVTSRSIVDPFRPNVPHVKKLKKSLPCCSNCKGPQLSSVHCPFFVEKVTIKRRTEQGRWGNEGFFAKVATTMLSSLTRLTKPISKTKDVVGASAVFHGCTVSNSIPSCSPTDIWMSRKVRYHVLFAGSIYFFRSTMSLRETILHYRYVAGTSLHWTLFPK